MLPIQWNLKKIFSKTKIQTGPEFYKTYTKNGPLKNNNIEFAFLTKKNNHKSIRCPAICDSRFHLVEQEVLTNRYSYPHFFSVFGFGWILRYPTQTRIKKTIFVGYRTQNQMQKTWFSLVFGFGFGYWFGIRFFRVRVRVRVRYKKIVFLCFLGLGTKTNKIGFE